MKLTNKIIISVLSCVCSGYGINPIVQTVYTADPAPMVKDGVLYLYAGHDQDNAPDNKYLMKDYLCFTSTDMVNWTHHGPVLDIKEVFSWSGGDANAAQCIFRDGKYYYYVSTGNTTSPGVSLGVAVSDSPFGPFKDALGKALVTNDQTTAAKHGWDDLDPTVFIDDDGRAFLYWGNNACYYAELNPDMVSLKGEIHSILQNNAEAFGPDFEEAPWFYKRNGIYYLVYASQFPEALRYATSKDPMGPWAFQGQIMDKPRQQGLGTNHPGVIDYQGNSYLFYHTAVLPNGGDKRRCICIEQFSYDADGKIPMVPYSEDGVKAIKNLDPYVKVEAETIAWEQGIETEKIGGDKLNVCVTDIDNGDYIVVKNVDFGDKGASKFQISTNNAVSGGQVELYLDSLTGTQIGVCPVKQGSESAVDSCAVTKAAGVHDLYIKFTGGEGKLFNADWWKFE